MNTEQRRQAVRYLLTTENPRELDAHALEAQAEGRRRPVCTDCAGSGIKSTHFEHEHTCRTCNGSGQR